MANFEDMSIEELTTFRAEQQQIESKAKAAFREAGLELERKIAATPYAQARKKIDEGRAEIAALTSQEG